MKKSIFSTQSGFSIIQGMVLAGAIGGMAYVGTKLMTDQKLAQKGVEARSKVEQLHSMIFSILENQHHCTSTFEAHNPSFNSLVGPCGPSCTSSYPIFAPTDFHQILPKDASAAAFASVNFTPGVTPTYMNNAVTIESMKLTQPSPFFALLKITYGKLDESTHRRTGKGFGAKQIAKTIRLKITRDKTNNIESCYAVDADQNEYIVEDFCQGLGPGLFTWNQYSQRCELNDIQCPLGQVFSGYDSTGARRCHNLKDWMNLGTIINQTSLSACNAATSNSVGFQIVGGKVQVVCGTSAPGCSSSCDCPGMTDVCEAGSCVDRSTGCIDGTFAKGDASCRFLCNGGYWTCPAPGPMVPPICGH